MRHVWLVAAMLALTGCDSEYPELWGKCIQTEKDICVSRVTMVTFKCETDYCPCQQTYTLCSIPCDQAKRPEHLELCAAGREKGMP
jgi:hypothetical protein